MRTSLNINIPEPCHEDWSKMTGLEKGRHCSSCEKTVFDFTSKTDEQIVKTFLDNGKVCGRFKSTQLNRELVLNRKEKNNYLSYVASTLFAFLSFGTQDVEAQGKPRIVNADSSQTATVNGKYGTSILNTKLIRGTIFNSDKFPIPNVEITIKDSRVSTTSNSDGSFLIKGKLENILVIKAAGYETAEITLNDFGKRQIYLKTNSSNDLNLDLEKQVSPRNSNEKLIEGTILSKTDGLPLPGTSVVNLRTKAKTYSDFDGLFLINVIEGDELRFAFIGMESMTLKVSKESFYNLKMAEDLTQLETVYVGNVSYKTIDRIQRSYKREKIKNGELKRTAVGKLLFNVTNIFRRKE